ncbi:MAG: zinc ribbon domain-containing protein, partial [Christensenellaceae bacterium]
MLISFSPGQGLKASFSLFSPEGLFSGLLFFADCGEKLYFCTTKRFSPRQEHYVCSNYKSNTGSCSVHFIREETLKLFVLQRIFDVTRVFFDDISSFRDTVRPLSICLPFSLRFVPITVAVDMNAFCK